MFNRPERASLKAKQISRSNNNNIRIIINKL
jgi:hypothetical protein